MLRLLTNSWFNFGSLAESRSSSTSLRFSNSNGLEIFKVLHYKILKFLVSDVMFPSSFQIMLLGYSVILVSWTKGLLILSSQKIKFRITDSLHFFFVSISLISALITISCHQLGLVMFVLVFSKFLIVTLSHLFMLFLIFLNTGT